MPSVSVGVERLFIDTANAVTIGDLDPDVAALTPGRAEGVLAQPVLFARSVVSPVADDQHSVVHFDTASCAVENASSILGEVVRVTVRADSHGLLGDGSLELRHVVSSYIGVACARDASRLGSVVPALACNTTALRVIGVVSERLRVVTIFVVVP